MSLQMYGRCQDIQASGIAKAVLMVLADNCGFSDTCYCPDLDRLAYQVCWSRQQVHEALRELETEGVIRSIGRQDNGLPIYRMTPEGEGVNGEG